MPISDIHQHQNGIHAAVLFVFVSNEKQTKKTEQNNNVQNKVNISFVAELRRKNCVRSFSG